ncbi:hypothetical protein LZK98_14280 [Sphingomonas cannabina]|uniref:hypothetical protein n=1 Tax=Sphingomonas cannabina TaxID=2899123 RepID=UPI001F2F9D25|nr:hypothetical protein [Sphingomonas cannabina]UIJ44233.1 hypothetical protein LZK98_14280 [Sphingomonas cannabina]
MHALRLHFLRHRRLALWLVGAALLMKLLVPAGFMPGLSNGSIVVQLCNGQGGAQTILMDIPGKPGDHDSGDPKKAEMPCAFSGLSAPALGPTDPILLAIAVAWIIATAFRIPVPPVLRRGIHLRPPSQGPPVIA